MLHLFPPDITYKLEMTEAGMMIASMIFHAGVGIIVALIGACGTILAAILTRSWGK
jgi:hypothetical protein